MEDQVSLTEMSKVSKHCSPHWPGDQTGCDATCHLVLIFHSFTQWSESPFSVVLYLSPFHTAADYLKTVQNGNLIRQITNRDWCNWQHHLFQRVSHFLRWDTTLTFLLQFSQNRLKPGILDLVIIKGCKEGQWKPFLFITIKVVICYEPKSSESSMTRPNAVWSIWYSSQAAFF